MPGIRTGIERRGAMPFPWEGRPKDLPLDVAYAVIDYMLNANWRQTFEAIGKVFITGIMCTEGTVTYGASDSTHCRLTLPTGFTEVDDYLVIGDGTRIWRVQVAVANEIEFTATQRINGAAGSSNYDGIQSSLWMLTLSKKKLGVFITQHEISLGDFADALDGDCIRVIHSNTQTIKAKLDFFDLEHGATGKHKDDIIENSMLDKTDVMITQGFVHKETNGAFNINGTASIDFWEGVDNPGTFQANANLTSEFPAFEMELETSGIGKGAKQLLGGCEKDCPLRLCFWAKGSTGGEEIMVRLSAGAISAEMPITLTSSWTIYYLTFTPITWSDIYVSFTALVGTTINWRTALVAIASGDIHTKPEKSAKDSIYDAVHKMTFFCSDPVTAGQFAGFTLEKNIKILRADAYARTVPAVADKVIRISDGATDYDITIASAANSGNNTADQKYDKTAVMTVSAIASAAINIADMTLVVQYRQN